MDGGTPLYVLMDLPFGFIDIIQCDQGKDGCDCLQWALSSANKECVAKSVSPTPQECAISQHREPPPRLSVLPNATGIPPRHLCAVSKNININPLPHTP